jgi:hypothetical protein
MTMNEKFARQVHQVLGAGLELRDKLARGEQPHLESEHARLKALLLGEGELRYATDYAGEKAAAGDPRNSLGALRGAEPFLGARYALACWLDELFINETPWADRWREQTLEVALYGGSSQRAWRFWEQAKKAESRPGVEASAVYFWCATLGFRGDPPADLQPAQWVEAVRKRLLAGSAADFPLPPERAAATNVPQLTGAARFATMLRVAAGVVALAAFAAGFLLLKPR